jgi:hypothetical protein
MILERLEVSPQELERRTGWEIKPEGACKAGRCIALPASADSVEGSLEGNLKGNLEGNLKAGTLSERLGMALVHDDAHGLWALGPEAGGRALGSAEMPDVVLPDRNGSPFSLRSLRGTKVILVAWASW